jgi:hypothetical protein
MVMICTMSRISRQGKRQWRWISSRKLSPSYLFLCSSILHAAALAHFFYFMLVPISRSRVLFFAIPRHLISNYHLLLVRLRLVGYRDIIPPFLVEAERKKRSSSNSCTISRLIPEIYAGASPNANNSHLLSASIMHTRSSLRFCRDILVPSLLYGVINQYFPFIVYPTSKSI